MNRREFIANGSATIATLALTSGATLELTGMLGAPRGDTSFAAQKLCRATFAQCVDSAFELHHTSLGSIGLKLSNLFDRPHDGRSEQFTLIFQAPKNAELTSGTFVMAHANTGLFPLYIESAGENEEGKLFRADFNLG